MSPFGSCGVQRVERGLLAASRNLAQSSMASNSGHMLWRATASLGMLPQPAPFPHPAPLRAARWKLTSQRARGVADPKHHAGVAGGDVEVGGAHATWRGEEQGRGRQTLGGKTMMQWTAAMLWHRVMMTTLRWEALTPPGEVSSRGGGDSNEDC